MGGVIYPPGDAGRRRLYGIPIAFEAYTLFYNKDLVDKYLAGVVPTTMDELIAAAEKINADGASDGVVGAVMRGIRSDTIMDTLTGVVLNAVGDIDSPDAVQHLVRRRLGRAAPDDPAVCKGLADYAGMLAAGPANKFAIDWPDANTLFQQGKAAFFIDASLFGPGYEDPEQSIVAGKTGYTVLPPQEAGGNSQTGHWLWGLGIPKNAANKDAAWYFIQYMTNKANTAEIGKSTGGAPRLSAYDDPGYIGIPRARVRRHRQRGDGRLAHDRGPQGGLEGRRAGHRRHRCWRSPTARRHGRLRGRQRGTLRGRQLAS